jgi:hypothetical protein
VIEKVKNRLITVSAAFVLIGCALTDSSLPVTGDFAAQLCLAFYSDLDKVVAEQGVTPSRPERIADFPYLRMTRFLASFRQQNLNGAALKRWLAHLATADQQARAIELASLNSAAKSKLNADYGSDLMAVVEDCAQKLVANDLADPARLTLLRKQAVTTSEYRLLNQVLGFYPLTRIPVRLGIHQYHEKTLAVFAQPLEALPVYGQLRRFHIPHLDAINPPGKVARDALGVPVPTVSQLQALFAIHAPVWEVDVVDNYDLPGRPVWHIDGKPGVDDSEAFIYRYPSYTRWQGQSLLQLNYLIWFAERPQESAFDIFSGRLDGLLWRVTLSTDGTVLVYDSVHACGCYHYFFPSAALVLRPKAQQLPEPPLLPQSAPELADGQSLVIRVSSGSHYLQRLYVDTASGQSLRWREYQELYATPVAGGGHRSLFRADGLVDGSERLERWLLWPMGVPSAGAMRERGRQATAFLGRRHFDDAKLLDNLFEPVSELVH